MSGIEKNCNLEDIIQVIEVNPAEFFVGNLFKRRFNTDTFPQEPFHFVAFSKLPNGSFLTLGYVHYYLLENSALCGGLVIDDRLYRQLPDSYRAEIKNNGGIAELLLRDSFAKLPNNLTAIWGYVGNPQSEKVCLRVGFERTFHKHILVVWKDAELAEIERNEQIQKIISIGPF